MEDMELRLGDLVALVLRKWRVLLYAGIAAAVVLGVGSLCWSLISMNDPKMLEKWQVEYEARNSQYWAGIHDVDYQIRDNEFAVERAEKELEDLEWLKESHEIEIEKIRDNIALYELQRQNLDKGIEQYQRDREKAEYLLKWRQEQNANSLYMAIDPYDVQTAVAYVRVDTGYQIMPGSIYQNPDQTGELLERYRLLVSSADFYGQMIADLKLNTEVRYLTEVVSVGKYNDNSLQVRAIGTDAAQLQQIVEYICNAMMEHLSDAAASVKAHTLEVYGQRSYSVVDMGVYTTQQANLREETNQEDEIRQLDMTILDAQARIRQVNADIRQYEQDIKDIEQAMAELPQKEAEIDQMIDLRRDSVAQLRMERLGLLEKPEPQYDGMTVRRILTGFVKFAVIGGVAGVFISTVWLVLSRLLGGKVLSAQHMAEFTGIPFFGVWPEAVGKKRPLAFVDSWMNKLTRVSAGDKKLVCANVAASAQGYSNILLCGSADAERIREVAAEVGTGCSGLQVMAAGSVDSDAEAVYGLMRCDAVILVEEIYQSDLVTVQAAMERAKGMDKPVLGVVMV